MTTEQPKAAQQAATQEQQPPQLPPGVVYSHPYNGAPYPHASGPYPPFYSYPPPAEGGAAENSVPPPPPPGFMMFPHPPPAFAPQQPAAPTQPSGKPKRKQVKMACTNCAAACKRCDEHRPCERCTKYGMPETCVDGQRKERKKGIKRGPYKRKNKDGTSEGEWSAGAAPPPANPPQPVQTMQAVPHQFPNGEGFYPIYYPPGAAPYLPPVPPHHEGGDGQTNGQPPLVPYYIPGAYPPPFGHYSPFLHGAPPPPPPPPAAPPPSASTAHSPPPQTVDPAATSSSTEPGPPPKDSPVPAEKTATNGVHATGTQANGDGAAGKKRKKSGESKSKRSKKSKGSKDANTAITTVEPAALSAAADEGTCAEGD